MTRRGFLAILVGALTARALPLPSPAPTPPAPTADEVVAGFEAWLRAEPEIVALIERTRARQLAAAQFYEEVALRRAVDGVVAQGEEGDGG